MRAIDMQTWPRREHFEKFKAFDHPHFGLCANMDVTAFCAAVKQRGCSLTVALVYVIARSANAIPEFRYRIRGGQVIEHDVVHPSAAILIDGDLFGFCLMPYVEDFSEFAAGAARAIADAREHPTLYDAPGQDDLLFMTALPWVSFTGFMHAMHLSPGDSFPRFAWGKIFEDGELLKLPLAVQGHHALMDGLHQARFYAEAQSHFSSPGFLR